MTIRFAPALGRATLCAFTVAAALWTPSAHAALQDRDLDGDTVVDAFYDTDLDITWLRDANVNGAQDWDTQVAWAANFSFGGYSDWRLPTADISCSNSDCTSGEIGHLYFVELGNVGGTSPVNTGGFQNVLGRYWSGTHLTSADAYVFFFALAPFLSGQQADANKFNNPSFAFAVRPGDVTAVPEPATGAMLMLGLGALVLAARYRPR